MQRSLFPKKSFSKNFSITTESFKKTKLNPVKPKLLDTAIEKTHVFMSKNGVKQTKQKIAKREAMNYLQNNKGIALVCKPSEGYL